MAKRVKFDRDILANLTFKEVNELIDILKDEYGIEPAAAAVAVAAGSVSLSKNVGEFCNIILKDSGPAKLAVVKEVKLFFNLGLREAKDIVDSAPSVIQTNMSLSNAKRLKSNLEAAGATVELDPNNRIEADYKSKLEVVVSKKIDMSIKTLDGISQEINSIRTSIKNITNLINSKIN